MASSENGRGKDDGSPNKVEKGKGNGISIDVRQ